MTINQRTKTQYFFKTESIFFQIELDWDTDNLPPVKISYIIIIIIVEIFWGDGLFFFPIWLVYWSTKMFFFSSLVRSYNFEVENDLFFFCFVLIGMLINQNIAGIYHIHLNSLYFGIEGVLCKANFWLSVAVFWFNSCRMP